MNKSSKKICSINNDRVAALLFPFTCVHICSSDSFGCFRISPEGVDIVLDCLCGENTGKGLSLLKPLGIYILYGRSDSCCLFLCANGVNPFSSHFWMLELLHFQCTGVLSLSRSLQLNE